MQNALKRNSEPTPFNSLEVLESVVEKLRSVRAKVHFTSMDGETAYYSALQTMASCIEDAVSGAKSERHP